MSGFDFVFALFSLLLGLAISEVLGGFSRVVKLHARARAGMEVGVRVGWLVPLLALWVLLQLLSGWMSAYSVRDTLPLTYITLVLVTLVVGTYYLLATLVWPDDPAAWPDFNDYYDRNNRVILTGTLVLQVSIAIMTAPYRHAPSAAGKAVADGTTGDIAALILFALLFANLVLIFVKHRALNAALLILLSLFNLSLAVIASTTGLVS